MGRRPAAAVDEEAELRALSAQAEQTRRALAETMDALTEAMSAHAHPGVIARHAVSRAAVSMRRSGMRRMATPAGRLAAITVPALIVVTAGTIYLLRRRAG